MKISITKYRLIGEGYPCYIIMDVGANHNGDLNQAKELIISAAKNGADAIKFQTYTAEKLYSKKTPIFSKDDLNPFDLIRKYQHPRDWLPLLNDIAHENNIDFTSSPFDYDAVDLLDEIDVPFYKIASPEIVDLELIEYIAKKQKSIVLSTGMSYLADIEDAVRVILKNDNDKIILLHCNTLYPTPIEAVNLKALQTLKETFKFPVGFSDHTLGIHISLAAVSMGANVIEKHFTLDKSDSGPDHAFAIEPQELKELVTKIREIESAMGSGIKEPHKLELAENFEKGRRSILAAQYIPKGTIISKDMLIVKRPGYGIRPKFINLIKGRKAKVDIEEDQWITWDMV